MSTSISGNQNPLVTIITATFNVESCLTDCILSILSQTYKNYEYIIIDGASTDGTIEIIKNYESKIAYWISEKDAGIYQAWNKGLIHANGDWVIFLGADDILLPNALETYINYINTHCDLPLDFISSKVKRIRPNGSIESVVGKPWRWSEFKYRMTTAHPGSFHARQLFSRYGGFSENYKIVSDYEILLRPGKLLKSGYINQITVLMSTGTNLRTIDATFEMVHMFNRSKHLGRVSLIFYSATVIAKFYVKELVKKLAKVDLSYRKLK